MRFFPLYWDMCVRESMSPVLSRMNLWNCWFKTKHKKKMKPLKENTERERCMKDKCTDVTELTQPAMGAAWPSFFVIFNRSFSKSADAQMDGGEQLRLLFQTCDRRRRGYIDRDEFGELCATFEIDSKDVDVIFADLDRDGDHRIRYTQCLFSNDVSSTLVNTQQFGRFLPGFPRFPRTQNG